MCSPVGAVSVHLQGASDVTSSQHAHQCGANFTACPDYERIRRSTCSCVPVSAGVYLMSPMLHTLTKNVSEDSVIAMIVGLSVLHLFLHDYK